VDADALVAGAFSTSGASHLILRLGELSILECVAPVQVREEAERNLRYKLPEALGTFHRLVEQVIRIVPDPPAEIVARFAGQAHPEDVSILTSAVLNECQYLLTFNTRHYFPTKDAPLVVLTPAKFMQRLRQAISRLTQAESGEQA